MHALVALGLGIALTPLARRLGVAAGLVDRPGDPTLAIHVRPTPVLGGAAVIAATIAGVALTGHSVPGAMIAAVCLSFATGMADDLRPLPAWQRLLALGASGAILTIGGFRIAAFGSAGAIAMVLITVLTANAANIVDGQNGLLGGLGVAAAIGIASLHGAGGVSRFTGPALAAAMIGFLVWNMRGEIFLGNGGAYAVGTMLAALAADGSRSGWAPLVGATLCLGAFVFEVLFTFARRALTGASIATGDRMHTYDLVAGRAGRTRSTLIFWTWAIGGAGAGIGASYLKVAPAFAVLAVAGAIATVAGLHSWRRHTIANLG